MDRDREGIFIGQESTAEKKWEKGKMETTENHVEYVHIGCQRIPESLREMTRDIGVVALTDWLKDHAPAEIYDLANAVVILGYGLEWEHNESIKKDGDFYLECADNISEVFASLEALGIDPRSCQY